MSALSDFFYEQAQKTLATIDPVPPAPIPSPGEAQDNKTGSVGSPYLCDWSMDTRPSYKLTDAEVIDKGRWQLESLRKREVLKRAMEVPTVYPPSEKS